MSKQLSRKQGHTGVITTAAAQAESMMLRPHNAAAMRRHEFVVTTQHCRTWKSALCGDHITLSMSLATLCGDHMTLPQPLAELCGDHTTLPTTLAELCGDHMTLPSFLGRYAQNYKKIETKNFQKKSSYNFRTDDKPRAIKLA